MVEVIEQHKVYSSASLPNNGDGNAPGLVESSGREDEIIETLTLKTRELEDENTDLHNEVNISWCFFK